MERRIHTLTVSGELSWRSARALEQEIERLCAERVTGVTLDLRGLASIDSIGAAMLRFRCGLCRRLGLELVVLAGSEHVRRACEQAGLEGVLLVTDDRSSPPLHVDALTVAESVDDAELAPAAGEGGGRA